MIFNVPLFVLAVGGKEQLWDLMGPVEGSDHSIMSVVLIVELDSRSQNLLLPMLIGLHVISQHQFHHLSIPIVKNLLAHLGGLVDKIVEVFGFNQGSDFLQAQC